MEDVVWQDYLLPHATHEAQAGLGQLLSDGGFIQTKDIYVLYRMNDFGTCQTKEEKVRDAGLTLPHSS